MEANERTLFIESVRQLLHNAPAANFSKSDMETELREKLIELNGGSAKITKKSLKRNPDLYALVEEMIPMLIEEGLKDDDFFNQLVEYRNVAEGDVNEFEVEKDMYYIVANNANGIRDVRRQKIDNSTSVRVPTVPKTVRIYEDLYRLMSGRIDWSKLVSKVAESFKKAVLADAYMAIASITADSSFVGSEYVYTGSAGDDESVLDLIAHVEAATGKAPAIYCTAKGARSLGASVTYFSGDQAQADLYNLGYIGSFYGTPIYTIRQAHKTGTSDFIIDDNRIYIIAGDDKPVKIVDEGDGYLYESDAVNQADLTQEYVYSQMSGTAVICAQAMGIYDIV